MNSDLVFDLINKRQYLAARDYIEISFSRQYALLSEQRDDESIMSSYRHLARTALIAIAQCAARAQSGELTLDFLTRTCALADNVLNFRVPK